MKSKHMLLMLACCAIPVVALIAVTVFNLPLGTVLTGALFLACPLSHLLMMRFMGHDHGEHAEHDAQGKLPDPTAHAGHLASHSLESHER